MFFVITARRSREKRGWKVSFYLLAADHAISAIKVVVFAINWWPGVGMLVFMITGISSIVHMLTLLVLAIVALIDLSRIRRDWLHCLGLGLYSGFSVMWFYYLIVNWFFSA